MGKVLKTIAQSIADIITKKNNNIGAVATRGVIPRDLNIDKSYEILSIRSQPNNNRSISNWYRPTTISQVGGTWQWVNLLDNTILNASSTNALSVEDETSSVKRLSLHYNDVKIWESQYLPNISYNVIGGTILANDNDKKFTAYICTDYSTSNDLVLKSDTAILADLTFNDFVLPSYFTIKDNTKIEIIITYSFHGTTGWKWLHVHNIYVRYINP